MTDDKRLIEDYLPIEAIAREGTTVQGPHQYAASLVGTASARCLPAAAYGCTRARFGIHAQRRL